MESIQPARWLILPVCLLRRMSFELPSGMRSSFTST